MTAHPIAPAGGVQLDEAPRDDTFAQTPWACLVWNDPVNTMNYVTEVFASYFGYPRAKAERLMWRVHRVGKAVVATGSREEMETNVMAMHGFGLWATLEAGE
ncbi:MAG: ATP-dependent Clp protease adapter ClpS [Propionibacteriaceae bacterium]|jgi:ATP-dependent Clp protease adaptor protein ClpS|nr:ATP-dependent Clp protease adapter ClpS [Propionibacteriaceae bacterium]